MSKILCVEDDDDSAFMLKQRLKRHGYQVVIAVNGEQGIEFAGSKQPDLILMDIDLPIINGLDATRQIKGAPETGSIPIIALTAHAMVGEYLTVQEMGGFQMCVARMDDELLALWDAPCDSPALSLG